MRGYLGLFFDGYWEWKTPSIRLLWDNWHDCEAVEFWWLGLVLYLKDYVVFFGEKNRDPLFNPFLVPFGLFSGYLQWPKAFAVWHDGDPSYAQAALFLVWFGYILLFEIYTESSIFFGSCSSPERNSFLNPLQRLRRYWSISFSSTFLIHLEAKKCWFDLVYFCLLFSLFSPLCNIFGNPFY